RRRHTRFSRDWSSDVCSSDLPVNGPSELVEAAIARIEALNPKLNAVVTPMFDRAREAVKGTLPEGPFTGVPFLLKDILGAHEGRSEERRVGEEVTARLW